MYQKTKEYGIEAEHNIPYSSIATPLLTMTNQHQGH